MNSNLTIKKEEIHLANNLKLARKRFKWSQEQAAKATGINRAKYASYEEGRANPPIDSLIKITRTFKIKDIDKFITQNFSSLTITKEPTIESKYRVLNPDIKKAVDILLDAK